MLVAIDVTSILVGFGIAIIARTVLFGVPSWAFLVSTLLPMYLVAALNNGAYASKSLQRPFYAVRCGLTALLFAIAAAILIGFSLKASESFARLIASLGFVLSAGFMFVGRYVFARHLERIIGGNPFNVVLIRDGDQPIPPGRFSIVIASDAVFDPSAHDPVMYDRFAKAVQGADRVIVACCPDRRDAWAHALQGSSVQGEIIVPELTALAPLGVDSYGGTLTAIVSTGPLGLADRAVKRLFDLVVAAGAAIMLSPLLVIVAIIIKLDSKGPILFKQTRIGRDNEMFEVMKFRSMQTELSDSVGHRSAARDDGRITRVGRIIRSTSIDELPQIFNVLKGDMSIVGPRPHALGSRAADKLFWEVDKRYWHRHAAKPGLTGLAQVRGFRGATLVEADLANRLHADLEYLEHWSIMRDIKIVLLTFRVLLHRNAF